MLPYEKLLRANVHIFCDKGNNQIENLPDSGQKNEITSN